MTVIDEAFLRDLFSAKLLFEDKWAPAIMGALYDGPLHYNEILSTVRSYRLFEGWSKQSMLHDGVLANTLKKMTAEGLLVRSEEAGVFPPAVSYSLDPEAASVLTACEPIVEWLRQHPQLVARAQEYRRPVIDGPTTGVSRALGEQAGMPRTQPSDQAAWRACS